MKKIFVLAFAAISLVACNETNNDNAATEADDNQATTTRSTSENAAYAPREGDVTYREEKVRVYRNGQWVETDEDVHLDNDIVVYRNGRVVRDGEEVDLEEGEVVTKTGDFFDRAGNSIKKGWKEAKEGVKEAGKEVGEAAKKAGKKLENAVDNDPE